MEKVNSDVLIENENLYKSLASAPIAILFVALATNSIMNDGILLFQIIFVLLAAYFSLSTLAYAAFYTNEHHASNADSIFDNTDFFKLVFNAPLGLVFGFFAYSTLQTNDHIIFKVILVGLAAFFILKTIASAAYYTNSKGA